MKEANNARESKGTGEKILSLAFKRKVNSSEHRKQRGRGRSENRCNEAVKLNRLNIASPYGDRWVRAGDLTLRDHAYKWLVHLNCLQRPRSTSSNRPANQKPLPPPWSNGKRWVQTFVVLDSSWREKRNGPPKNHWHYLGRKHLPRVLATSNSIIHRLHKINQTGGKKRKEVRKVQQKISSICKLNPQKKNLSWKTRPFTIKPIISVPGTKYLRQQIKRYVTNHAGHPSPLNPSKSRNTATVVLRELNPSCPSSTQGGLLLSCWFLRCCWLGWTEGGYFEMSRSRCTDPL